MNIPNNKERISKIGNYGIEVRNSNGDELIEFAVQNNIKIANTFLKKKQKRNYTWVSPDQR